MATAKKRTPELVKSDPGRPSPRPVPDPVDKESPGPVGKTASAATESTGERIRRRGRPRKGQELRQTESRPDEMRRAVSLLDELVRTFGGSRRQMDKLLGTGRSRTSQLLSGRLDLKFQHILDILEALGIESRAFFEVLYGEEEHAPFPAPLAVVYRQKLRSMGIGVPGVPGPSAAEGTPAKPSDPAIPRFLTEDEVRQMIDHRLFEAFSQVMAKKPGRSSNDPGASE